ncbi:PSD1 and planctomycete cytochrome C domain-containing protein [Schlesneria paludicola]|uniref:PSD1 and planctomycete cytochrome C domain-containing protein n=1 Tax=Schlesneria paludicola TaxID=360056 RepID=UPI00029A2672|nr:PSD1 and planctomycete cytochrome C domain-containing protein [Schlesneria paludicola]
MTWLRVRPCWLTGLILLWNCWPGLAADPPSSIAEVRYNRDVLPILAEHCFLCHGFDKGTRQAGLRLDSAAGATAPLGSGTKAIVPGDPAASELVRRINSHDTDEVMPPAVTGKTLSSDQRETIIRWIEQGASYEAHWAYIPPQITQPPVLEGIPLVIDRFVRDRLQREGIPAARPTNRETLVRRLSLDLTGLPPTVLEVDAFLNDSRMDAYERVVERLLASPHFGERWARWWLDLAHYADSDGYLQDFLRPYAWRYRQWVVDAFNRDLSFDKFTIEQLAGDLLPDATTSQRIATGFLRNTLSNREGGADLEEYRVRQVVDRTTMVGVVWMGLTVGCAECHDHKFDAISQREFYQLYAFFNNADEVNLDAPLNDERERYRSAKQTYDHKRAELLAPVAQAAADLQKAWEEKLLWTETHPGEDHRWDRHLEVLGLIWGQGQGEGQLEGLNIVKTEVSARTPSECDRLQDYFLQHGSAIDSQKFSDLKLGELATKLDQLAKTVPAISRAPTMTRSRRHRTTHLHRRGDFRQPGEELSPSTLSSLPPILTRSVPDRLVLAKWLVSRDHPLTARVTVNRIWQEMFGRGLVGTSENFGVRGDRPTHPELLDWLAIEFMQNEWSFKSLMRTIVMSQTYQQSSRVLPEVVARDPQNRLVARQARLRLSAETVRDAALASSGLLSRNIGGPSVRPPQPESVTKEAFDNQWVASQGADRYRRGLYTFLQRTSPFAQFVTFDLPDSSRTCTRRERSNTPLQALNLLNDPTFVEAAQALADRVCREIKDDDMARLDHVYLLTLARRPTMDESNRLLEYLKLQRTLFQSDQRAALELVGGELDGQSLSERAAWIALASVLLNLDETITRE